MKVRRPSFDFSETPAHWAQVPEFAQNSNATSLWIPSLERFLNRVLARALSQLKDDEKLTPELKSEVRTFIRQESNHYALHDAFNTILPRGGYEVDHFVTFFEAEFERLFQTKSLAFLTAYCEGFETLGPPAAIKWLDENEANIEGARPEVVGLWKWHLLEEYEHRTVCHDLFHVVHGGYFLRIYVFLYQLRQLTGFSKMVLDHLLEIDRKTMTPQQRAESIKRQKAVAKEQRRAMLPRLLAVFSPFYTPRNAQEPRMFKNYRAEVEAGLT